ncbi:MAG: 2Fe-2S iron-sulfur cluster-binding protein [Burkholderiales bacterium]
MTSILPTRRDLRLASGLVLFTYIALHLANHALGLVSVATAERALDVAVRLWHSVPGTMLLYGAAITHVALALNALYRRRTLRMPPLEVLRIALGLGIPILLIGHFVNTRFAWEAYRIAPDYGTVVWRLWTSDSEGRQLAMLVPGWLHGCLGVNFAFSRRTWYRRARPVLFAAALLLPVLGGLGFLAMGKELASDTANRAFLDDNADVDAATRIALSRIRDAALACWFALIGAIFVAREVRAVVERRRNAVVTIAYPRGTARVPIGWTVLDASRSHHIPHMSMCGGQARCSTCRVEVTAGDEHCPPPSDAERATLARVGAPPGVRLACQLKPTGDVAVVPLVAVPAAAFASAASPGVVDRDVAVVRVVWRRRAEFARTHLPHDFVYLSLLFGDTAAASLRTSGGAVAAPGTGSITAVFGLATPLPVACRDALAAAAGVERALAGLARRYRAEFGGDAGFATLVHAGSGAIGEAALIDAGRLLAAGEVFETLDVMQSSLDALSPPIVASQRVRAEADGPP